jgi:hypothetical protein
MTGTARSARGAGREALDRRDVRAGEGPSDTACGRLAVPRCLHGEAHLDPASATAVGVDLPGPDTSGTDRDQVVREDKGDDDHGHDAESAPTSFGVHRVGSCDCVGRDDEHIHALLHGPPKRILERHDSPPIFGVFRREPAQQCASASRVGLDPTGVGFRMSGEVPIGGQANGHRSSAPERHAQEHLMPDVKPVEGTPEDCPTNSRHVAPDLDPDVPRYEQDQ